MSSTDCSVQEAVAGKDEDVPDSPTQDEFVSDTFNQQQLSEEEVRREMEQLGVKDDKKEGQWDLDHSWSFCLLRL